MGTPKGLLVENRAYAVAALLTGKLGRLSLGWLIRNDEERLEEGFEGR